MGESTISGAAIAASRTGVKFIDVAATLHNTFVLGDDSIIYAWGDSRTNLAAIEFVPKIEDIPAIFRRSIS